METQEYKTMNQLERAYWWFHGKRFLVEMLLNRLIKVEAEPPSLLDIGCGTGMIMELLNGFGKAYGIDFSPQAIQILKHHKVKSLVHADATRSIPFKSATFFAITSLDVLEHVDDDVSALEEAFRVCKPGGYMLLTVPAFDILWSSHDVALHHKRRYKRTQILNKATGLGWQVTMCSYYNTALFLPILLFRKIGNRRKGTPKVESDFSIHLPQWLNRILSFLFTSEIRILRYIDLPFGVSLISVLRKPVELPGRKRCDET